jgi:hypothetical protein
MSTIDMARGQETTSFVPRAPLRQYLHSSLDGTRVGDGAGDHSSRSAAMDGRVMWRAHVRPINRQGAHTEDLEMHYTPGGR